MRCMRSARAMGDEVRRRFAPQCWIGDTCPKGMLRLAQRLGFMTRRGFALERDPFRMNHRAHLTFCLRMIFSENRFPLFGIMR